MVRKSPIDNHFFKDGQKKLWNSISKHATFARRCINAACPELIDGHSLFEKLEEKLLAISR
jgi:hypothetical protein